ncbi:hypothetical protein BO99DRAFT_242472 [Aspergillus violaceofuscus CBS 115571]|uniref:Secreted protein n=1 Tax=Aspergillus violaceofuscus (strain CBS 115571) TaxID=1450538 RepID=A0A2V5HGR2_ASPV1|nr:hypothetical protein BO99DRAFT_242472 [Aspergillus violaceofuscus CBS 115571]
MMIVIVPRLSFSPSLLLSSCILVSLYPPSPSLIQSSSQCDCSCRHHGHPSIYRSKCDARILLPYLQSLSALISYPSYPETAFTISDP